MIAPLPWDSAFFGLRVGRVDHPAGVPWDHEAFLVRAGGFDVVYIFSDAALEHPHLLPVDVKVVFEHTVEQGTAYGTGDTTVLPMMRSSPDLLNLAFESGIHSRFKKDPGFPAGSYERLYQRWLDNALERSDEQVLVVMAQEMIEGFVTLSFTGVPTIGLIAVEQHARGKGIASALLQACMAAVQAHGGNRLLVATQEQNPEAIALYRRNGFSIVERKHVHHYWGGRGSPDAITGLAEGSTHAGE